MIAVRSPLAGAPAPATDTDTANSRRVAHDAVRTLADTSTIIVTAKYGDAVRWTISPTARVTGGTCWDAGPVGDWCESPAQTEWEAISGARRAPHWPTTEPRS